MKQNFLKISIPIQEIDTSNTNFYYLIAKGQLSGVDMGLKLLIDKSFRPIFGVENGDIAQISDAIEAQVENGLILFGGENILNHLINRMAQEWNLRPCPVTNDLSCDGQLLWGNMSNLKPYKYHKMSSIKIEFADCYQNILTKDTSLNQLRFKALGFYEVKFLEQNFEKREIVNVPFFINIDLSNFVVIIEEKDIDLRDEFINLFSLDESYHEERLNNKDKVMLIAKSVTFSNKSE